MSEAEIPWRTGRPLAGDIIENTDTGERFIFVGYFDPLNSREFYASPDKWKIVSEVRFFREESA